MIYFNPAVVLVALMIGYCIGITFETSSVDINLDFDDQKSIRRKRFWLGAVGGTLAIYLIFLFIQVGK